MTPTPELTAGQGAPERDQSQAADGACGSASAREKTDVWGMYTTVATQ